MFRFVNKIFAPNDLWSAAQQGDVEAIRKFVAEGANVNAKKNTLNATGWTPIHFAAFYKQGEAIRELVKLGGKINARDDDGDRPLVLAIKNGADIALVDLMIELGADINKGAETPLGIAICNGNQELVRHLLSRGASPKESVNRSVAGPLWSAAGNGNISIVQMLLKAGAEVNSSPEKKML